MLGMGHSPRLSCPPVEEWGLLPQSQSRGWCHSWPRSPTPPSYSVMLNVIRCKLSFSLVDSAIMCIRGARSRLKRPAVSSDSPVLIDGAIKQTLDQLTSQHLANQLLHDTSPFTFDLANYCLLHARFFRQWSDMQPCVLFEYHSLV